MIAILLLLVLIPFCGTVIGAAFVFFMKHEIPALLQKILLGFASGVMVSAAVWSLLIPGIEMSGDSSNGLLPAAGGFLLGMGFLLLIDYITPHLHVGDTTPEGPRSRLSKTAMLSLAVTIHNLPEGMAVGVVISSFLTGVGHQTFMMALATAIGIAIQNIPEGAIVAMPLRSAGNSRLKSFVVGSLSGIVEPVGTIIIILLSTMLTPVLPWLLSFAAGAMMYVVVEELIPEASHGSHSNLGTIGFAIGFALMMTLDIALG